MQTARYWMLEREIGVNLGADWDHRDSTATLQINLAILDG